MRVVGFTLIEIIIVLIVISILTLMSVECINYFYDKTKSDMLHLELLRALHLSQSEAILRHEKIFLCSTEDEKNCSMTWKKHYIIKSFQKIIYRFQFDLKTGILHWRSFPRDKTILEFTPNGFPDAENGTFWFCNQRAVKPSWAIFLNQLGRTRSAYPDHQGEIKDSHGQLLVC